MLTEFKGPLKHHSQTHAIKYFTANNVLSKYKHHCDIETWKLVCSPDSPKQKRTDKLCLPSWLRNRYWPGHWVLLNGLLERAGGAPDYFSPKELDVWHYTKTLRYFSNGIISLSPQSGTWICVLSTFVISIGIIVNYITEPWNIWGACSDLFFKLSSMLAIFPFETFLDSHSLSIIRVAEAWKYLFSIWMLQL